MAEPTELEVAAARLRDVITKLPLPYEAMAVIGTLNSCLAIARVNALTDSVKAIIGYLTADENPPSFIPLEKLETQHMHAMADSLPEQFSSRLVQAIPKINGKLM
jgi:hypothetical protein